MSSIDEKLSIAEDKAARSARYRDKLLVIKTAEAEIPSLWDTGQVSMTTLAENYGISPMTVRRILSDAGRQTRRFKKLNEEERAEVLKYVQQGISMEELSNSYLVSKATIRRIAIEGGVVTSGDRKPRRSDEDYLLIQSFDDEARARFNGAGLYNLGMGLRQWQAKKKAAARAAMLAAELVHAPPVPRPEPEPEPAPEPQPEPRPVPAQEDVPVVFGDGIEDAAAVVGPYAPQADPKPGFSF